MATSRQLAPARKNHFARACAAITSILFLLTAACSEPSLEEKLAKSCAVERVVRYDEFGRLPETDVDDKLASAGSVIGPADSEVLSRSRDDRQYFEMWDPDYKGIAVRFNDSAVFCCKQVGGPTGTEYVPIIFDCDEAGKVS